MPCMTQMMNILSEMQADTAATCAATPNINIYKRTSLPPLDDITERQNHNNRPADILNFINDTNMQIK